MERALKTRHQSGIAHLGFFFTLWAEFELRMCPNDFGLKRVAPTKNQIEGEMGRDRPIMSHWRILGNVGVDACIAGLNYPISGLLPGIRGVGSEAGKPVADEENFKRNSVAAMLGLRWLDAFWMKLGERPWLRNDGPWFPLDAEGRFGLPGLASGWQAKA